MTMHNSTAEKPSKNIFSRLFTAVAPKTRAKKIIAGVTIAALFLITAGSALFTAAMLSPVFFTFLTVGIPALFATAIASPILPFVLMGLAAVGVLAIIGIVATVLIVKVAKHLRNKKIDSKDGEEAFKRSKHTPSAKTAIAIPAATPTATALHSTLGQTTTTAAAAAATATTTVDFGPFADPRTASTITAEDAALFSPETPATIDTRPNTADLTSSQGQATTTTTEAAAAMAAAASSTAQPPAATVAAKPAANLTFSPVTFNNKGKAPIATTPANLPPAMPARPTQTATPKPAASNITSVPSTPLLDPSPNTNPHPVPERDFPGTASAFERTLLVPTTPMQGAGSSRIIHGASSELSVSQLGDAPTPSEQQLKNQSLEQSEISYPAPMPPLFASTTATSIPQEPASSTHAAPPPPPPPSRSAAAATATKTEKKNKGSTATNAPTLTVPEQAAQAAMGRTPHTVSTVANIGTTPPTANKPVGQLAQALARIPMFARALGNDTQPTSTAMPGQQQSLTDSSAPWQDLAQSRRTVMQTPAPAKKDAQKQGTNLGVYKEPTPAEEEVRRLGQQAVTTAAEDFLRARRAAISDSVMPKKELEWSALPADADTTSAAASPTQSNATGSSVQTTTHPLAQVQDIDFSHLMPVTPVPSSLRTDGSAAADSAAYLESLATAQQAAATATAASPAAKPEQQVATPVTATLPTASPAKQATATATGTPAAKAAVTPTNGSGRKLPPQPQPTTPVSSASRATGNPAMVASPDAASKPSWGRTILSHITPLKTVSNNNKPTPQAVTTPVIKPASSPAAQQPATSATTSATQAASATSSSSIFDSAIIVPKTEETTGKAPTTTQ